MQIDSTVVATVGTAIVGPVIAYLKIRDERSKTSDSRDAKEALMNKRVSDLETKIVVLDELRESINQINISLARIQTTLEMFLKASERK